MDTTTSLQPNEAGARLRWTQSPPGVFKLAGILHIETAVAFRQLLSAIFARPSQLTSDLAESFATQVDLSEVEVCGTPGVQLLLSAQKTAARKGIAISFIRPSPAVESAFSRFSLEGPFQTNVPNEVQL